MNTIEMTKRVIFFQCEIVKFLGKNSVRFSLNRRHPSLNRRHCYPVTSTTVTQQMHSSSTAVSQKYQSTTEAYNNMYIQRLKVIMYVYDASAPYRLNIANFLGTTDFI